jgi:cytochrome c nitrite reductase small subunit
MAMGERVVGRTEQAPGRSRPRPALVPIALALGIGALVGLGGYTFRYAEGLSYFSTDPKACVNCHIMQPQYDGWQKSSHHAVAVCIDCHLPEELFAKYFAKAENGWRHGKLFTTQTFREPIEIQAAGRRILQDNCVRCHVALVDSMLGGAAAPEHADDRQPRCVHCHWTVGHGEKAGLGGPPRGPELDAAETQGVGAGTPVP